MKEDEEKPFLENGEGEGVGVGIFKDKRRRFRSATRVCVGIIKRKEERGK